MGFCFSRPNPTAAADSKTVSHERRSEKRPTTMQRKGVPAEFASATPTLRGVRRRDTFPAAPPAVSGQNKREVYESPPNSPRDAVCVDHDGLESSPSTCVQAGERNQGHVGAAHGVPSTKPEYVLTHRLSFDPCFTSTRRSDNPSFLCSPGISSGLFCLDDQTNESPTANGLMRQVGSARTPVGACQVGGILQHGSFSSDSNSPSQPNPQLSRERLASLQNISAVMVPMPRRGSVRFLSSDVDDTELQGTTSPLLSAHGNQNKVGRSSPGAKVSEGIPLTPPNHLRLHSSLNPTSAGVDKKSPSSKISPQVCGLLPTVLLRLPRATSSLSQSIEDAPLDPLKQNDLFEGFVAFDGNENSDKSGDHEDAGGSLSLLMAPAVAAAPLNSSPSPKSILLRPGMSISGTGGVPSLQGALLSSRPSDCVSQASCRFNRRRRSEQAGASSDRRPSFSQNIPRYTTVSRYHRSGRSDDSSGEDEHLLENVQAAFSRLHPSDGSGSLCPSTTRRAENKRSLAERRSRALSAAKKMSETLLGLSDEKNASEEGTRLLSDSLNAESGYDFTANDAQESTG